MFLPLLLRLALFFLADLRGGLWVDGGLRLIAGRLYKPQPDFLRGNVVKSFSPSRAFKQAGPPARPPGKVTVMYYALTRYSLIAAGGTPINVAP